jgi:phosphoribosylanthranilate isomerase
LKKKDLSLKRNILVKNVSNLSDARYCAAMGVQIMGFAVDPKDLGYISPDTILEIKEWVEGIEIALQVGTLEENEIRELIEKINSDIIICDASNHLEINGLSCKLYSSFSNLQNLHNDDWINPAQDINGYIFKLPDPHNGNKLTDSLHKMNSLPQISVFVEMPNLEDHIEEYSNSWKNIGYVLSGGKETTVGFKDFNELAPVLEFLED